MKLSARNVLKGKIAAVVKGVTTAHVKIDVGHGHRHHLFHHGRGRQGSKAQKGRRRLCHYQSFGSHCRQGIRDRDSPKSNNELPRSKLGVSKVHRANDSNTVSPECFHRGPDPDSPGFPLKACGNDGRWIAN